MGGHREKQDTMQVIASESRESASSVQAIRWIGDERTGHLELLDQRKLPDTVDFIDLHTAEATAEAIREMVVRGAPAIGWTAAWGIVLAAQELGRSVTLDALGHAFECLLNARPTAVNLRWAIERMMRTLEAYEGDNPLHRLYEEAVAIGHEDYTANTRMGDYGAGLLRTGSTVLTHCNTGALATAGYGTALGVIRSAYAAGKLRNVFVDETRPYLQGARLTMWELMKEGIPATLITDSMAGHLMSEGEVDAVVVGADRIAANGDTANKIGTYTLAVLAKHHRIPFYVVAPTSTIDPATDSGASIEIEQRSADEVTMLKDIALAPAGSKARHPAFDITPSDLVTAIITENGVARPPFSLEDEAQKNA
jgi:methylthioribose-1-phosphate isomerase